jgi:phosphoglycolate phosphatase
MKYKLVIFDFDGTLADSMPWFLSVINDVAEKYGFKPLDLGNVKNLRHNGLQKMLKLHGIPFWKTPFISNHMRKRMTQDVHRIHRFNGVPEMLRHLKEKNVTLALVSSNSYNNICSILGPENINCIKYFACGISIFGKQSKFRKILRNAGLAPNDALCIGDEIRDVEAAQKVGIPFGAVSWGYNCLEALRIHGPHEFFNSIEEIPRKLASDA